MSSKISSVTKANEVSLSYGKNYKSALKECDKRLTKDPGNPYLLYWKALIFWRSGRRAPCLLVLHDLCNREAVVSDLDLIKAVYTLLCYMRFEDQPDSSTAGPESLRLWTNAIKSKRSSWDKSPAMLMFQVACELNLWEDARLAMSLLLKENRNEPNYYFCYIAVCQLSAELLKHSEPAKSQLNSDLAFGFISRAAQQALTDSVTLNAISNARQFRLAMQIYWKQGRRREMLSLLDNPKIGIESTVAKNDWEFERLRIEAMAGESLWSEVWNQCNNLLDQVLRNPPDLERVARAVTNGNDWIVWRHLLQASWELDNDDIKAQTEACVNRHALPDPQRRNAWIARLYLYMHKEKNLLAACEAFFDQFSDFPFCFSDLRIFVEQLSPKDQKSFRLHTSKHACARAPRRDSSEVQGSRWFVTELNSLKFDYLLGISMVKNPSRTILEAFVCNSLRLHRLFRNVSYPEIDQPGIVAAMGLIRLHSLNLSSSFPSQSCLTQAACILQSTLEFASDSTQARMWLIKVQMHLGLASLGMVNYSKLNVKEVLHDNVSHMVYTRIASIHPQAGFTARASSCTEAIKDPAVGLAKIHAMFLRSMKKISGFQGEVLQSQDFDQLSEFQELRDGLSRSFTRYMSVLEARRVARARGKVSEVTNGEDNPVWPQLIKDNRDLNVMADLECSSASRLETQISSSAQPKVLWLALFTSIDNIWSLLTSQRAIADPTNKVQAILESADKNDIAELTPAEAAIWVAWSRLRPVVDILVKETEGKSGDIVRDLQGVHDWLKEAGNAHTSKQQIYLHGLLPEFHVIEPMFLQLEAIRACRKIGQAALMISKQKSHHLKQKLSSKQAIGIINLVEETHSHIRQRALDWKSNLFEGGLGRLIDQIVNGPTGETLEEVLGPETVESYASLFRESAEDTLDGILQAKVV